MFQYIPKTMSIKERADLEYAQRETSRLRALLDYVAMMADVELIEEGDQFDEPEV